LKFIYNLSSRSVLYIVILASLISINLFLTSLPLTNTLGYEFAALNGILLFLVGGILICVRKNEIDSKSLNHLYVKYRYFLTATVFVPFLIGLGSSIIVSKCPIFDGLLFYMIISIPSFIFGMATGYFSVIILRKYAFLIFLFFFLLCLSAPLLEFYLNPQIFFYNPVFGYYPGTIYDEDLSPDHILIAYRIFNLAFFIYLVYISQKIYDKGLRIKALVLLSLFITIALFSFFKPALNFASNKNKLDKSLPKTLNTNSFTIHFPEDFSNSEIEHSGLLHEYYLAQINDFLNIKFKGKIDSYVFKNREQKRMLLGAGNADIAKPWLNQIYLNGSDYAVTLKHELAHIIGNKFGTTPFKAADNLNPSMIEGFAMAVENNFQGYPVHYMAKLADSAGYKFPVEKLFAGFNFFSKTSSISYIYSGSFIKYLADTYGVEKIKRIYGNTDFPLIYGKDITALSVEYADFLKEYSIKYNVSKAQLFFGGSTIFKKFCPRVAASETKKASIMLSKSKTIEALQLFKKVYNYSGSAQSLIGIINCLYKEKKYSVAEKQLVAELPNFRTSPYLFYLELLYGELLARTGSSGSVLTVYDSLLVQNPDIVYTNEVLLRKEIVSEGIDSLKTYFDENETMKFKKLLEINKNGIKYFSIPLLLQLSEKTEYNSKELLDWLKNKISVTDPVSAHAALKISQFALHHSELKLAQYFATLALSVNNDINDYHRYVENLRMVNWFVNNEKDIKNTFN